jgi:hypothetical protein
MLSSPVRRGQALGLTQINDAGAHLPLAFRFWKRSRRTAMSVQDISAPQAGWPLEKYVFGAVMGLAYAVAAFAIVYPFYMYLN